MLCRLVFVTLICFLFSYNGECRLLDYDDLLIGEWNAKIRCSPSFYHTKLFPPKSSDVLQQQQQQQQQLISQNPLLNQHHHQQRYQQIKVNRIPTQKQKLQNQEQGQVIMTRASLKKPWQLLRNIPWQRTQSFECRLRIFSNGTFNLIPAPQELDSSQLVLPLLPLRGTWIARPNPYCSTDRFYDKIFFDSYVRTQKLSDVSDNMTQETLQSLKIGMSCRLYGHHTGGRLRCSTAFAKGKITHGSLVVYDMYNYYGHRSWLRLPRVAASFQAIRWIPSSDYLSFQQEENDKLIFGY